MRRLRWYPANYSGFGIKNSRVYLTPLGQVLCVLAQDIDPVHADPIVMACGLRPSGNGGDCWCVVPLLAPEESEPPFPNACFRNLAEVESYLEAQCEGGLLGSDPQPPIGEEEFFEFVDFINNRFELPGV